MCVCPNCKKKVWEFGVDAWTCDCFLWVLRNKHLRRYKLKGKVIE